MNEGNNDRLQNHLNSEFADTSNAKDKNKRRKLPRKRFWSYCFIGLFSCILALALAVFIVLKIGVSGAFLTARIQTALSKQLANIASATLTNTRLSLDEDNHISFEAENVILQDIIGGVIVDKIGRFKVGLSSLALLKGNLEIEQIALYNSNIILPKNKGGNILNLLPQDKFGRVDPDTIANQLFPSFDKVDRLLKKVSVELIALNNISIGFVDSSSEPVFIENVKFRTHEATTNLIARLSYNDKNIVLDGTVNYANALANTIELNLSHLPLHLGAADDVSPYLANGRINIGHFKLKGNTNVSLIAKRDAVETPPQIHIKISMPTGLLDLGAEQNIPTEFAINLEHLPQSRKIEIQPSKLIMGGVDVTFDGALGLVPATDDSQKPENDYRFEFISNEALSASPAIPESALKFSTKIAGQFKLSDKKAFIDEFVVNTPHGNILGQGSLRFGVGTPETIFVLHAPKIDIAEAKQLWPINIARGARQWVATHIFGGNLQNGILEIALPLGFFRSGIPAEPLTENEIKIRADIVNTRSDLVGDLPALRDISGNVAIDGTTTHIRFDRGIGYLPNEQEIQISDGSVVIPWNLQRPIYADMHFVAKGDVASTGDVIGYKPINAKSKLPFNSDIAKGNVVTSIDLRFPVNKDEPSGEITYNAKVDFTDVSLLETGNEINIKDAVGSAEISKEFVKVNAKALINDLPSSIEIVQAFNNSDIKNSEKITLTLDDATREKYFSFLNSFLKGAITVDIGKNIAGKRHITANLTNAVLEIPWIGWKKSKAIAAKAEFDVPANLMQTSEYKIENFTLTGANLAILGNISIKNKQLLAAEFSKVQVNRNDQLSLNISNTGKVYNIAIKGQKFDARSIIQKIGSTIGGANSDMALNITANIAKIKGFYNETLNNFVLQYSINAKNNVALNLNAITNQKIPVDVQMKITNGEQFVTVNSANAGAVLRFVNYYDKMEGGILNVQVKTGQGNSLAGPVSIRDFTLVNEEKLAKLVSSKSPKGGKSLNDAVNGKINSTRVKFDLAYAEIAKGDNYLVLDLGVLRGPVVGATFQGIYYDAAGNMSLTGTFMPAYGLNRIFGDLPLIGKILGNGRDGGLLGITFKVEGDAKQPQIIVNPISVIAPGIFRSIFEFQ